MQLDSLDAFALPLGSKPFALGGLADRTISLRAIFTVVLMAFRAMRFLRVDIASGSGVAFRILGCRYDHQMLRIHAGAISAGVINDHALRNHSSGNKQCDAVRLSASPSECNYSVAITVPVSDPFHALAGAAPFGIESRNFLRRHIAHIRLFLMVTMDNMVHSLRGAI